MLAIARTFVVLEAVHANPSLLRPFATTNVGDAVAFNARELVGFDRNASIAEEARLVSDAFEGPKFFTLDVNPAHL